MTETTTDEGDDAAIGYADAMAELESILDDLEDDDLDVDLLASRVERASTLIQVCRDRIGAAKVQVERVVASLDATTGGGVASLDATTGGGASLDVTGDSDAVLDLDVDE